MKPVDRELLSRYLAGELDDARGAEVEANVAADPAWAAALQREAQVEMMLFEVADAAPVAEAAPVAVAEPWYASILNWLKRPQGVGVLALAAAALFVMLSPTEVVVVPAYGLQVHSGDRVQRSGEHPAGGRARYSTGSALELDLVPASSWEGRPLVVVLLDGAPLTGLTVEPAPGGGLSLYGVWGEDLAAPAAGEHEVVVELRFGDGSMQQLEHPMRWSAP